jgi:hypothetical protein
MQPIKNLFFSKRNQLERELLIQMGYINNSGLYDEFFESDQASQLIVILGDELYEK